MSTQIPALPTERVALRQALRDRRQAFAASLGAQQAQATLGASLHALVQQLEPECLGLYWPLEGEFNAPAWALNHSLQKHLTLALPFARKGGDRDARRMDFRRWDGQAPTLHDECGIPSCEGSVLVPDVLLVPCVGFTREGYRLGYGGGYFDRWLAAHPGVTTVGLAWSVCEASFAIEEHDQALTIVLTETELLAP